MQIRFTSYISNSYVHSVVSYEPRRLIGFASIIPNPADMAIKIAASHPNVFLDTSYSLVTVVEEIGPKGFSVYVKHSKISLSAPRSDNIPGLTPGWLSARRQIEIIMEMPGLSDDEKEMILSRNAVKLIDLKRFPNRI